MADKTCPSCSANIPVQAKFCPECGAPLTADSGQPRPAAPAGTNRVRDIGIIVGVLAVMTAAYFIFRKPQVVPVPPPTDTSYEAKQMQGQTQTPPHPDVAGGPMAGMAVLDSLPKDYPHLVDLGNTNMDHGEYAIAAECYRRALALDSSSVDVRVDYGACLHSMGLPDRAIQEFNRALAEHPDHTIAKFNLGVVYMSKNQNDSARVYFDRYLKAEPNGRASDAAKGFLKQLGG